MKKKLISIGVTLIILLNLTLPVLAAEKETEKITAHTAMTHTQEQIKQKYKESAIVNKTSDLYQEVPVTTSPYKAGSLKSQVKTDTLNQINYFRWLAGVNNVTIYEQFMEYAQKGAVILAANNKLTHFPTKPDGMNDEFYNSGKRGTAGDFISDGFWKNGFNMTSGNISRGSLMAYSIKGYVDDTNNVEPNVGHRLSILDPLAKNTVFGYANNYGVVDMLSTYTELNDAFYSWPSPGNFPVESMDAGAKWSIEFMNPTYFVNGDIEIRIKANGKTYSSRNNDFELHYEEFYEAYYFDIPTELKQYLTDGGYKLIDGKKVEVEVHNIVDNRGNTYIISYPVNFFTVQDYKLGDVDGNGEINAQDAVMILKHVARNITLNNKQFLAADTSKDGHVNAQDATRILKYVAKNITEF